MDSEKIRRTDLLRIGWATDKILYEIGKLITDIDYIAPNDQQSNAIRRVVLTRIQAEIDVINERNT